MGSPSLRCPSACFSLIVALLALQALGMGYGITALMKAADTSDGEIVGMLLEAKADPDVKADDVRPSP